MRRTSLPILRDCDVLIVDGSLGGIAAALSLARCGRRVVLAESRTYLGREITATLRPWLSEPQAGTPLPRLLHECTAPATGSPVDGERPLHMNALKCGLEDALLEAGIQLLYATRPVALHREDGRLRGVVVANKSGRQLITCTTVIDTSATAIAARIGGAAFDTAGDTESRFMRTVEFDNVSEPLPRRLTIPENLGIDGSAVTVHRGHRGEGHVLLEHAVMLPRNVDSAVGLTRREARARRVSEALVDYLYASEPAFAEAAPGGASHELSGPSVPLVDSVPPWAEALGDIDGGMSAGSFAGPLPGLWVLSDAARLDEHHQQALRDPAGAVRAGEALASVIDASWDIVQNAVPADADAGPTPQSCSETHDVHELDQPRTAHPYDHGTVAPLHVPVVCTTDVLVAGGGTSGVMASITAARGGARTTLIDMNPGLGGTGTYGGIDLLWFPRPFGCTNEFFGQISDMHDRMHQKRPQGIMPSYVIPARLRVLMAAAEDAGVEQFLNSIAFGTTVEADTVRGVVVATPFGPAAIDATVVIDATGDGDIAAFAGAECVLGSDREHMVMYALMPEENRPGHFLNVKTSMLDVTDIEDVTRMILAERRRHRGSPHDHSIYLAPRESRHVLGDVYLTLADQLLQRSWPDVVYIAFSNCDMKGAGASDLHLMGLQSPNYMIEIPYRALLPRGLHGLLVAGKAYSATHDAIAAPRMQPDMENLGGVAGIAAAMAVHAMIPPDRLDIQALQNELARQTFLPPTVLERDLLTFSPGDDDLRELIDALDPDTPLSEYSNHQVGELYESRVPIVDLLCAGPRVVPLLEEAHAQAAGRRKTLLARALAAVGSREGVPTLAEAVLDELAEGSLPSRAVTVRHAGLPPNQTAAPYAAHLLFSLGMSPDERALPVWERVAALLESTTLEQMVDKWQGQYWYVDAVCYGAERLGSPAAVGLLQRLHGYRVLHDLTRTEGVQVDWFEERIAHLELVIGRALARCGSVDGYRILSSYLHDNRAILAEHAHAELCAISGERFAKETAAWNAWIDSNAAARGPVPWTCPLEPMTMWGQEILTGTLEHRTAHAVASGAH